jgi:hypothetical protein
MLAYLTKLNKTKGKQYGKHVSHADYKDQMPSYHLRGLEKLLLHNKTCKHTTSTADTLKQACQTCGPLQAHLRPAQRKEVSSLRTKH